MRKTGPKIRPIVYVILFFMALFCCRTASAGDAPQVSTNKDAYGPGETITVNFSDSPGNNSDWICIVPAGSPDTEAGEYQYLPKGLSQGALTFNTPPPGKYEVRAYYDYRRNGYVVSGRSAFSVESSAPSAESKTAPPAKPAASPGRATAVEKSAATSIPRGAPRYSVSVFHFKPVNMDSTGYGITVTSTLIRAPGMQAAFSVMDRKDLETFLVANDLQQNDQIENVTHIGTRLGIDFVIAGSVEKRGTMIITNCKVISVEKRAVIFTNQAVSIGEAGLIGNILKMSDAIVEAILRSAS